MTEDELVAVLEALRPKVAAFGERERRIPGLRGGFPYELETQVAELIGPFLTLPVTRPFGGIHLTIRGPQLAHPFLWRLIEGGPSVAVAWLTKMASIETADVRVVAEVRGLIVSGVVELPGDVRLAATSLAPQSPRIAALEPTSIEEFHRRALEPPTIVAWKELRGLRWEDERDGDRAYGQAATALRRAVLGLTLAPGQAPLITRLWAEFVDNDLDDAVAGTGWVPQLDDGAPLLELVPGITESDIGPAADYLRAPEALAEALELALSRVSLARRRRQVANQAIEICTALESPYGDPGNKTELTYRLRLRAALYLGETLDERRTIRSTLGKLYDLRSQTVHGDTPKKVDHALIPFGIDIAVRTIRKIVAARRRPDWSALELDPPPLR